VFSKVGANFLNFMLSLPVLIIFIFLFKVRIGLPLVYFPLLVVIEFFLTSGITLFLSALNVFYRDIQFIIMNLMTFLFFSLPIMYFDSNLPLKIRHIIYLDPIAYLMKCFQNIFYFNMFPRPYYVLGVLLISLLFYIIGYSYFASRKELFSEFV
jgi:lipopolysaccharide transport system permease protein